MEKQIIISIGREYGSGGKGIAYKLAEIFGFPVYEANMLKHITENGELDYDVAKEMDEKPTERFWNSLGYTGHNTIQEQVAFAQFDFLREKAESGESFIVLGRCAEYILRGREALSTVFIRSSKEAKIKRVIEEYKDVDNEHDAISIMNHIDKRRKSYHNYYADGKWGDSRTYDLCVNSEVLGIDGTAELVTHFVKSKHDL